MMKLAARLHFLPIVFVPFVALALFGLMAGVSVVGCGGSYTSEDATANSIALRHDQHTHDLCATDDAGTCTPAAVRAHADLAFCADAREVLAHSGTIPEGGIQCQPAQ